MNISWIFAIVSPMVWGFMNVFDKYAVTHRVKHIMGFAVVAGFVNILLGISLASFLDWSEASRAGIAAAVIAGIFLGLQVYVYYRILRNHDVSYIIGIYYVYPLVVMILALLILNEVISGLGYIGMILIIAGALMLTIRSHRLRIKLLSWSLFLIIIVGAFSEIFAKLSTNTLPPLQGIAVNSIALGSVLVPALLIPRIRKGFIGELVNVKYALMGEVLTLLGIGTWYFALQGLPVTVVASVGAAQPLWVLLFERIAHHRFGNMTKDPLILPKLIATGLIVCGIVILYLFS